jgi:peptidoglycan hydrolase CwlO-like protein
MSNKTKGGKMADESDPMLDKLSALEAQRDSLTNQINGVNNQLRNMQAAMAALQRELIGVMHSIKTIEELRQ